jgi:hypothetical protein
MALTVLNKYAEDKRKYSFDYSDLTEIAGGDTIASVGTITAAPSGLTIGTGVVNGTHVDCIISGGTAGVSYVLSCPATLTSTAQKICKGILYVE